MNNFSFFYGLSELPDGAKVFHRKAAKAIVLKNESVLMILTNKGDYKFPGGGYNETENVQQCLQRELLEETGYSLLYINRCVGNVLERYPDKFQEGCFFSMNSEYYFCTIDESFQQEQMLDEYEKEQDFQPVFVDFKTAIENNEKLLTSDSGEINNWVKRETDVLKQLFR